MGETEARRPTLLRSEVRRLRSRSSVPAQASLDTAMLKDTVAQEHDLMSGR